MHVGLMAIIRIYQPTAKHNQTEQVIFHQVLLHLHVQQLQV